VEKSNNNTRKILEKYIFAQLPEAKEKWVTSVNKKQR
jgi:hypothetical protein